MTIETELPSPSKTEQPEFVPPIIEKLNSARIAMLGFDPTVSGQMLLYDVLRSYLINWWDASVADTRADANILVLNEDMSALHDLVRSRDITRPIVLLTTLRGDDGLSSVLQSLDTLDGFYRVVFKPCRPSHLFAALKDCVQVLTRSSTSSPDYVASSATRLVAQHRHFMFSDEDDSREEHVQTAFGSGPRGSPFPDPRQSVPRRRSDELPLKKRPEMPVRSTTFVSNSSKQPVFTTATAASRMQVPFAPHTPSDPPGTVALADGSSLVLDSIRRSITNTPTRVLVVEDNPVNRSLLVQWLHKKVEPPMEVPWPHA
jgi:CheY-like chemotaxis protein